MKRNLQITPKEPAWKQGLMNSLVLTAKPDEKGYLPSYLDGIYPGGREAMMPDVKFYRMFNVGEKSVFNPTEIAGNEIPPSGMNSCPTSAMRTPPCLQNGTISAADR